VYEPDVDAVLPWLYLRGIAQADVGPALAALVGREAANLSGPVIGRLKASWAAEYAAWQRADLSRERWAYVWVPAFVNAPRVQRFDEDSVSRFHQGPRPKASSEVRIYGCNLPLRAVIE
jgi:hypothetical protein